MDDEDLAMSPGSASLHGKTTGVHPFYISEHFSLEAVSGNFCTLLYNSAKVNSIIQQRFVKQLIFLNTFIQLANTY